MLTFVIIIVAIVFIAHIFGYRLMRPFVIGAKGAGKKTNIKVSEVYVIFAILLSSIFLWYAAPMIYKVKSKDNHLSLPLMSDRNVVKDYEESITDFDKSLPVPRISNQENIANKMWKRLLQDGGNSDEWFLLANTQLQYGNFDHAAFAIIKAFNSAQSENEKKEIARYMASFLNSFRYRGNYYYYMRYLLDKAIV